ncbi:MAG: protein kinase [Pyrinomonadaceae bacterium]|nr:protein kinase [Pyrinomonadaceae bacterium]
MAVTPERQQCIQELFQSAAGLALVDRRAFLERACEGDTSLIKEVESLLEESAEIDGSLTSSPQEISSETVVENQAVVGKLIAHYKVLSLLGKGGMGEVYLAQDTRLGRKVALKLLPTPLSQDKGRVQRFEREARSASALNHPNVCVIHEIGETDDGRRFIAMEHINGETLRHRLVAGALTLNESLDIALQCASALAVAHEAGVVHRDIKPENLMLRGDGYVKVLDFGLAKLTERYSADSDSEAATLPVFNTHSEMMIGTINYLSPEQARRQEVDERTDLWSLGVVLYEMLTGRMPFTGETNSHAIVAILEREPTPVTESLPGMPSELEWIVTKALRKDRDQRYQTAREFAIDLGHLKEGLSKGVVTQEKPHPRQPLRWPYLIAAVAAILVLISTGLYLLVGRNNEATNFASINSVAVLPFANMSGDPNMDYLSDGITDSLINSLSELPDIKVIGRSSVFRYKGSHTDAQAVGKDLSVQAVLTGRITERDGDLLIYVDLEDARDNSHIWGEQYNRKTSDILAIQNDISRVITEKLRVRITGEYQKRLAKPDTDNVEAYRLYLKGRWFWNKRTMEGKKQATLCFQQAIDLDSNYALAYAGLADIYVLDSSVPLRDSYLRAKAAVAKALALDGSLGEAHATLGFIKSHYENDWAGGEAEFKRAIELNPNYATAHHWYADQLLARGEFNQALQELRRAQELDPLSPIINTDIGLVYFYSRDYDRSIEYFRRMCELFPDFFPAHLYLGWAYTQKQMYSEATTEYQRAATFAKGHVLVSAMTGYNYAVSGNQEEARKILKELKDRSSREWIPPLRFAIIYAGLGQKDQALEWLNRANDELDLLLIYIKVSPFFDALRKDPRFVALLARLHLASQ